MIDILYTVLGVVLGAFLVLGITIYIDTADWHNSWKFWRWK